MISEVADRVGGVRLWDAVLDLGGRTVKGM